MKQSTKSAPEGKVTWDWDWRPQGALPGSVSITVRGQTTSYYVTRLLGAHESFGLCYLFDKWNTCQGTDGEAKCYHVRVNEHGAECECKGYLRWGKCKHLIVCAELAQEELPMSEPATKVRGRLRQVNERTWYIETATVCGDLMVCRFHDDFPAGRPFHVVGCGQFFASLEDVVAWVQSIVDGDEDGPDSGITYTGYGANTHAPCGN